jgi:hypothetical protein
MISILGLYGALAEPVAGTHAILGRGETTCLKCHYDKYDEMVSTAHGEEIVVRMTQTDYLGNTRATANQPETFACISCHAQRDRWTQLGMADYVNWFENKSSNAFPGEYWALGYKQIAWPLGPGLNVGSITRASLPVGTTLYKDPAAFKAITSALSTIKLNVTGTTGRTINATITFSNLVNAGLNTPAVRTVTLSEPTPGNFYYNFGSVYPDYFKISLNITSGSTMTATKIVITTDGVTELAADSSKLSSTGVAQSQSLTASSATLLRALRISNGSWGMTSFSGNDYWNFHTGYYSKITKLSEVWEETRQVAEQEFPARGIPVEYMGIVGEKAGCASQKALCHTTITAINLGASGALPETYGTTSGSDPYYKHTLTISTDSSKTCGTCHADKFIDGMTAHFGVQCFKCHSGHTAAAATRGP